MFFHKFKKKKKGFHQLANNFKSGGLPKDSELTKIRNKERKEFNFRLKLAELVRFFSSCAACVCVCVCFCAN